MTHPMTILACLAILGMPMHEALAAHVLDNGRVNVVFGDTSNGLSGDDNDRVDSIAWMTSGGTSTGNLASNGGPLQCGDPLEFFGQAYGEASNSQPFLVIAGDTSNWSGKPGNMLAGKTKVNVTKICTNAPVGGTSTSYMLTKSASRINQLSVTRTFSFKTVNTAGNLRAYVPRLPEGAYGAVLWPNAAGVIQSGNAGGCSGGCEVTDWNGKWFADINAAGQGLIVIRNPAKGLPAVMVFDNDSFSNSNNSAVALVQPAGGWLGKIVEKQNLCFFDAVSWPASRQAAGKLPVGCTAP